MHCRAHDIRRFETRNPRLRFAGFPLWSPPRRRHILTKLWPASVREAKTLGWSMLRWTRPSGAKCTINAQTDCVVGVTTDRHRKCRHSGALLLLPARRDAHRAECCHPLQPGYSHARRAERHKGAPETDPINLGRRRVPDRGRDTLPRTWVFQLSLASGGLRDLVRRY